MGRIEEMARDKEFKSLRDLGLRLAETAPDHKSGYIANKVRELDKGKDLGWWTGTGRKYWSALADILGVDETELLNAAEQSAEEPASRGVNLWPFEMFPGLRPLDLGAEKPFPGLPGELTRTGGPQRSPMWWVAPAGAGKTLLGRWLEVKFGWITLRARSWSDAVAQLPATGRVYLELESWQDVTMDPARHVGTDVRLCVAASGRPPSPSPPRRSRRSRLWDEPEEEAPLTGVGPWHIVQSPDAHDWMSALLDWVTARLRKPEGFQPARVRVLLEDPAISSLLDTPGEALDLFGVIDAVGIETRSGESVDPMRWAKAWLRAAAERVDRTVPRGIEVHLRTAGVDVLLAATRDRLRQGLGTSLSRDVWASLMPQQHAAGTDFSEIYALAESDDPKVLAEIRRRLRPDGASWVAGLEAIGALCETPDGLVVRPAWLARVVEGRAHEVLCDDVPAGLGALLLNAQSSEMVVDQLTEEVVSGELKRLLPIAAGIDPTSPEHLAWLDGAVRATGLALSAGAEVPIDLVEVLWQRAQEVADQRYPNLPAVPILGVASTDQWRGRTTMGAWFLAMFMLSRTLTKAGRSPASSALNPWAGDLGELETERLQEAVSRAASAGQGTQDEDADPELMSAAFQLGGDLLDTVGVLRRHNQLVDVQVPHLLVTLSLGEAFDLSEAEMKHVLRLPTGLQSVTDAVARRGESLHEVLAWCWRSWAASTPADSPPFRWVHDGGRRGQTTPEARAVWEAARAELLTDEICEQMGQWPGIWAALSPAVWERWLAAWAAKESRWHQADGMFELLPEHLAVRAVREGSVDAYCHEIRRVLWRRMPDPLTALVDELIREPPRLDPKLPTHGGPVTDLVWSSPDPLLPQFVERAAIWLNYPETYPGAGDWLWRWLMSVVEGRKPGWRDAFALLSARRAASAAKPLSGRRKR